MQKLLNFVLASVLTLAIGLSTGQSGQAQISLSESLVESDHAGLPSKVNRCMGGLDFDQWLLFWLLILDWYGSVLWAASVSSGVAEFEYECPLANQF